MQPKFIIYLFLLCLTCWSLSCKSKKHNSIDNFYTEKGEWDSGRIPLLKPYELLITDKDYGWSLNLNGDDGDTGFYNVKQVNIIHNIIFVYNINSILHGNNVKQSWHIIIPNQHIEKGFSTHRDYINYLKTIGIKNEPSLLGVEKVVDYFDKHDTIDWKLIN